MKKNRLFVIFFIALLFSACQTLPTEAPGTGPYTNPTENNLHGYPITEDSSSGYPVSDNQSNYPIGPLFSINTPVKAGETVVTGTGPSDVPIKLVDTTEVGLVLGEVTISKDGTFIFNLTTPLQSGHSIGLQLGDITNTDLNEEDFTFNETYYERPFIGILFDLVIVQ